MPYADKVVAAAHRKSLAQAERERLRNLAVKAGVTLHAYRKQKQPLYYGLHCLLIHRRRWARKKGIEFTIKRAYLAELYQKQNGLCPLTGQPLRLDAGFEYQNATIDRKDSKLGYVPGNVRLLCFWANVARGTLTDAEFKAWCKLVVNKRSKGAK